MADDVTTAEAPSDDTSSDDAIVRPMPDDAVLAELLAAFEAASFELREYASSDVQYHAVFVPVADWVAFAEEAKAAGYDTFIDLAAVDHYTEAPRFEVALNLLDLDRAERIIVSTRVPYDDPSVPSLTGVFAGANFYEREAFDLLGIDFPNHPDLTRILLPDDWDGHPLRKDYDIGAVPVEFKAGSVDL